MGVFVVLDWKQTVQSWKYCCREIRSREQCKSSPERRCLDWWHEAALFVSTRVVLLRGTKPRWTKWRLGNFKEAQVRWRQQPRRRFEKAYSLVWVSWYGLCLVLHQ